MWLSDSSPIYRSEGNLETLNKQAEQAAQRVDVDAVGFSIFTITTILMQVLPMLAACWNRNDSPTAAESKATLQRYYDTQPEKLRKRTARRIRAETEQPMLKAASFALADAVIAQALSVSNETVAACCSEAGIEL